MAKKATAKPKARPDIPVYAEFPGNTGQLYEQTRTMRARHFSGKFKIKGSKKVHENTLLCSTDADGLFVLTPDELAANWTIIPSRIWL